MPGRVRAGRARERADMRSNGLSGGRDAAGSKAASLRSVGTPRSPARGKGQGQQPNDHVDEGKLLEVLTALRRGNFAPRLPLKWTGVGGKVADTVNEIMEANQRLARELERLARLVGKEGKIGHRAPIGDFTGLWASSVESVNTLVGDLVHPTSEMARVIGAVAKGDLTQTMALDFDGRSLQGEFLRSAKTVNRMVEQLGAFSSEVTRVVREVGTEGKLGGPAEGGGGGGRVRGVTESVNFMAANLTGQVRNIDEATTDATSGDLSKK